MNKKFTRRILLLSLIVLSGLLKVSAQPGIGISYTFSSSNSVTAFPGLPVVISTQAVPAANQDDFGYLLAPAGMSVRFAGVTYQKIVVSTNGWCALVPNSVLTVPAALSAGGYLSTNSLSTYTGGYPILAPFWDDIATTTFSYVYNAGALWVRWTAKIDKTNATPANLFWLRIDGATGQVSYFHTASAYTVSGIPSASIGVAGVCPGDYYSYNFTTSPAWADSTIETSNIATKPVNKTFNFNPNQPYDNCATAKDIGPLTPACNFSTYNINFATSSGPGVSCSPGGTDVADMWFKITKPAAVTSVTVSTGSAAPACQSVLGTTIEVFVGCPGVSVGCSTTGSIVNFGEIVLTRPCSTEVLYIRVTGDGDIGGKFQICATGVTPPVTGQDCASATLVCGVPYHNTGLNTQGFVNDYDTNIICQSPFMGGEDYVFVYTPATTQCVNISIDGTGANSFPGLHVLIGCPDDTLNSHCIANATNTSNGDTIFNLTLAANHTYYIIVDNRASTAGVNHIPFNFHITPSVTSAPPNDDCGSAISLGTIPFNATCVWSASYTTECSTPSPLVGYPDPGCGGYTPGAINDVWFTFMPSFSGSLQINGQGGPINPAINLAFAVYTQTCGNFALVGCAGDSVAVPHSPSLSIAVTNGVIYYVRVWTSNGFDPGSFRMCFLANCSPPNDFPVNAIPFNLGVVTLGDNTCSTAANEMPNPVNCTSAPVNTVWFKLVVPPSGNVAVRIAQLSLLDAALAAFVFPTGPANAATSFTRLACNDDIIFAPPCPICGMTGDNDAAIQFTATAGSTVYIAVDGEFSAVGTFYITAIEGTLSGTFPPVPLKDCANPGFICANNNYLVPNGGIGSDGNICDFQNLACPGGIATSEVGSTWVQFTVSPGSQLGFTITPNDSANPVANYNFYLWDITNVVNICAQLTSIAPIRCNTIAGTGKTGLRLPAIGPYSALVAANATSHTYMMFVQNLTSANDDEGVPGTNTGFTLNWDLWSGGINIGSTQITGTSPSCTWSGAVIDTNYLNAANWKGIGNCPAPAPSCTTDVFISAASKMCQVMGNCYAKSILINPGGTLTLMPGSNLHICGNYTNNGSLVAMGTSTITFEGPGNQTINGALTGANAFPNLVINKVAASGNVTMSTNLDVNESFTTSNGTSIFNINSRYLKVGGNFTNNNANVTFTGVSASTIEFFGTTNNNFTNQNGSLSLNRVRMNKTAGKIYLTGSNSIMNIDSILILTSGQIVTRSLANLEVNLRWFQPVGPVTAHNATSYIDGRLRRRVRNGAFSSPPIPASYDFPVGDSLTPGGYELANITFTSPTQVIDLTSTFDPWPSGAPATGPVASECLVATYSNLPIFDHGYWTFKRSTSVFTGNYNVSLYNTGFTNNTGAGWTVAKTDTGSNVSLPASWRLQGNCVITSTSGNTQRSNMNPVPYYDSTSFNHRYTTVQTDLVLPIELLYFTAEPKGQSVVCNWETASETNNDHFILEKSRDGREFEPIATISGYGEGTSTHAISYSFYDEEICNDIVYYRLKQIDIDGVYSYSEIVAVNCKSKSSFTVHPNPAHSSVTISFNSPTNDIVDLNFIDFTGRTVLSKKEQVKKGFVQLVVYIEDLAKGVYTVEMRSSINSDKPKQVRFFKD